MPSSKKNVRVDGRENVYFYVENDSDMTEARKVAILEDFTKNSVLLGKGRDEEVYD